MGTHPIFESDFDCLTDCRQIAFFGSKMSEKEPRTPLKSPAAPYSQAWAQYYAQQQQSQGQQGSPAAAAAAPPTHDYSKVWEEYFRRTGQHAQAAAIANQQTPTKSEPAASNGAQQPSSNSANGSQDYSAQWAEYYRKLAEYQKANGGQQPQSAQSGPANPGY